MRPEKRKANNEAEIMHQDRNDIQVRDKRPKGNFQNFELAVQFASRISLPYFASDSELPAGLPTAAEIADSHEILQERTAAKVVVVGPHFVVKYGKHINLDEGRTMKLAEAAGILVTRVYALYHELDKNYIVMERIHGETLKVAWQSLSEHDKHNVAAQIKGHVQMLRQIPSPGGFCSLDKKPLRDDLFWTEPGRESSGCSGPFDSELDLVQAIIAKCKMSEALKRKASLYEAILPLIFRDIYLYLLTATYNERTSWYEQTVNKAMLLSILTGNVAVGILRSGNMFKPSAAAAFSRTIGMIGCPRFWNLFQANTLFCISCNVR